jgi:hypothetical protein
MSIKFFRIIVILSLLSVIAAISSSIFLEFEFPKAIYDYQNSLMERPMNNWDWISFFAVVVAFFANISLLFFSNFGRHLYASCIPFTFFLTSFEPEVVITNTIEQQLYSIDGLLSGGVLCLCYFSNISQQFSKTNKPIKRD